MPKKTSGTLRPEYKKELDEFIENYYATFLGYAKKILKTRDDDAPMELVHEWITGAYDGSHQEIQFRNGSPLNFVYLELRGLAGNKRVNKQAQFDDGKSVTKVMRTRTLSNGTLIETPGYDVASIRGSLDGLFDNLKYSTWTTEQQLDREKVLEDIYRAIPDYQRALLTLWIRGTSPTKIHKEMSAYLGRPYDRHDVGNHLAMIIKKGREVVQAHFPDVQVGDLV